MPQSATVDELIQLVIQAQRATEMVYRQLVRMFTHVVEIAQFIERFAAEESGHIIWLQNLRSQLTSEKLAAPAIPLIYQDAMKIRQFPMEDRLQDIQTLEDAYHFIVDVVNGEANHVLGALINTYYEDEKTRAFLQDQLQRHMDRITDAFPPDYDNRNARLAIKALREASDE